MKSHVMLQVVLCTLLLSFFCTHTADDFLINEAVRDVAAACTLLRENAQEVEKTNPEFAKSIKRELDVLQSEISDNIEKMEINKKTHRVYQENGIEKMALSSLFGSKIVEFGYEENITKALIGDLIRVVGLWEDDLEVDREAFYGAQKQKRTNIICCIDQINQQVISKMEEFDRDQAEQKFIELMDKIALQNSGAGS